VGSTRIWKSSTRLADGREIIYYDETPDSGRAGFADTRHLPPAATAPQPDLVMDWLVHEWVLMSPARQHRTLLPGDDQCPLCPSAPGHATEIPAPSYDVAVFENRFPALPRGKGRCEVICYSDEHDASFATLSERRARTILHAWIDRTAVLSELPDVWHVYCFENRGEQIGASLQHPHGQVYALPFVAPHVLRICDTIEKYAQWEGGDLLEDQIRAAEAAESLIVARNEHWLACVPAAARWPYQVRIYALPRVPDLPSLSEAQRDAFGSLYLAVLRALDRIFGSPLPYLADWQQCPPRHISRDARATFALHLDVMSPQRAAGRLKYLASTEVGAGVWSNDVLPENAARTIREAM